MQNEKEKFKENFVKRLIAFTVEVVKFCRELKKDSKEAEEISKVIAASVLTLKGKKDAF